MEPITQVINETSSLFTSGQTMYIALMMIVINALTFLIKELIDQKKKLNISTATFMLDKRMAILEKKFTLIQHISLMVMNNYINAEVRLEIDKLRVNTGLEKLYLERYEIKKIRETCSVFEVIINQGKHGDERIETILNAIKKNLYS
jgi:hypothetical protein